MTATTSQPTVARNQTNDPVRGIPQQSSAKQAKLQQSRGFLSALLRALSMWAM